MSEYPKTMVHPAHQKSEVTPVKTRDVAGRTVTDHFGTADKFPPVTVHNKDQEDSHRAKGYRLTSDKILSLRYQDYPVWMQNEAGDEKIAESVDEEERLVLQGFGRKGKGDPEAVEKAFSSPFDPEFEQDEYPKMVNGVMVDAPEKEEVLDTIYPMWVGGKLVYSEAEELSAREGKLYRGGKLVDPVTKTVPVVDVAKDLWAGIAALKGIEVTQDMTAEDIEAAVYGSTKQEDDLESLRKEAVDLGIKPHHLWKAARLRQEIDAAKKD